jgi:hypothetical protein
MTTSIVISIDSLYCPITKQIFNEPVLSEDCIIYEEDALILKGPIYNEYGDSIDYTYIRCSDKKEQVRQYLLNNPEKISEQYKIS